MAEILTLSGPGFDECSAKAKTQAEKMAAALHELEMARATVLVNVQGGMLPAEVAEGTLSEQIVKLAQLWLDERGLWQNEKAWVENLAGAMRGLIKAGDAVADAVVNAGQECSAWHDARTAATDMLTALAKPSETPAKAEGAPETEEPPYGGDGEAKEQ